MIQSRVVVSVDDLNLLAFQPQYLDRFNAFFVLSQAWCWRMIREYKPIENEVTVIWVIPKIASIAVIFFPFSILRPQSLEFISPTLKHAKQVPHGSPIPTRIHPSV